MAQNSIIMLCLKLLLKSKKAVSLAAAVVKVGINSTYRLYRKLELMV